MPVPRVKICGLVRREDAAHAAEAGAGYLGAVLVPDTPRARTPAEARELFAGLALPSVAVVADLGLRGTVEAAEISGVSVVQLHGAETPDVAERIRESGPWEVWKALRIRTGKDLLEGVSLYGQVADGLLLDAWHPTRKGGTGKVFPWEELEKLRGRIPAGLLLAVAGGLNPGNVGDAVARLGPGVVDVSSGVELEPGRKDPRKVEAFIREAFRAGQTGQ